MFVGNASNPNLFIAASIDSSGDQSANSDKSPTKQVSPSHHVFSKLSPKRQKVADEIFQVSGSHWGRIVLQVSHHLHMTKIVYSPKILPKVLVKQLFRRSSQVVPGSANSSTMLALQPFQLIPVITSTPP